MQIKINYQYHTPILEIKSPPHFFPYPKWIPRVHILIRNATSMQPALPIFY